MGFTPVFQASEELRQQLTCRLKDALYYLFPAGRIVNNTFVIGNLAGDSGSSLKVVLSGHKLALWHDFATGEGGDIFCLWGKVHGLDHRQQFSKIVSSINAWLGELPQLSTRSPSSPQKKSINLGSPTGKWDYEDGTGNLIACVYRYETANGKQFRLWDAKAKVYKAPNPRPLYNQEGISRSDRVIVVEGEKCAQALIDLGICATIENHV